MILLALNVRQVFTESSQFVEALGWLQTSDHDKVMRHKFENDRRLALASQLLRRYAFVNYYGMTWDELEFGQAQQGGKPTLLRHDGYDFNVSHHGDWVTLVATDQGHQVGIDVVCTDSIPSMSADDIIDGFAPQLAQEEYAMLKADPHPTEAFYAIWALKESYVKARGIGLYMELDQLQFRNDQSKIELVGQPEWHFRLNWLDDKTLCAVCASSKQLGAGQLIGDSAPTMQHPFTLVTFSDVSRASLPPPP
ncbi:4'-phosphopantetheinyl transferase superfamily [Fennellomyces sp. T-0311]|nr:4'-phosphopantetheinyl transferase superfamily [Fennellomyces sp. T-0311]